MTSKELQDRAEKSFDNYASKYPDDIDVLKYAFMLGSMSADAADLIEQARHIKVEDSDILDLIGYTLFVYDGSRPAKTKGSIQFTHHQNKALLRLLVENWVGGDIDDWECVDLSGLEE
jgi:hypothetical protein